jgi:hypothetical protein
MIQYAKKQYFKCKCGRLYLNPNQSADPGYNQCPQCKEDKYWNIRITNPELLKSPEYNPGFTTPVRVTLEDMVQLSRKS